jgi:ribosome-associated protein
MTPDRHIPFIPESELQESFVRASGPGGQNVNKLSTAVQLRFDAGRSPSLPEDVRQRLLKIAGHRLVADGIIQITARRLRTQEANRRDARHRLLELIGQAARPPVPRIKTRPPGASRKQRLEGKRRVSGKKRLRRRPLGED